MKLSSSTIVLLISSVAAQQYLEDGVLYYGAASATTPVATGLWCDNPGSYCDVDLCCGIGIPDPDAAANQAQIPV